MMSKFKWLYLEFYLSRRQKIKKSIGQLLTKRNIE